MTEKNTGLIYIRLSQTRDESDENSVERQIANCVRVCEVYVVKSFRTQQALR